MNYWEECLSESFDINGLKATPEQIKAIAYDVQISHENFGMFHGHDCIPNPLETEVETLKKALKKEQDKRVCEECKGRGVTHSYGCTFMSTSRCSNCDGEGKC